MSMSSSLLPACRLQCKDAGAHLASHCDSDCSLMHDPAFLSLCLMQTGEQASAASLTANAMMPSRCTVDTCCVMLT